MYKKLNIIDYRKPSDITKKLLLANTPKCYNNIT